MPVPVATTTTLAVSGARRVGAPVTLTATVHPAGSSGTVHFRDGTAEIGSVAVLAGSATFTTSALGGGVHSLTAQLTPGSAGSAPSTSGPVLIKVLRWTSKTLLTLSSRSGPAGAAVTASVEVRGGFGTPSGAVEILDHGKVIATGMLVVVAGRRSTVAITLAGTLAAGRHTLTAVFAGNDVLYLSRGSASYRVGPPRT